MQCNQHLVHPACQVIHLRSNDSAWSTKADGSVVEHLHSAESSPLPAFAPDYTMRYRHTMLFPGAPPAPALPLFLREARPCSDDENRKYRRSPTPYVANFRQERPTNICAIL